MILADLIPLGATGLPAGFENARFPAVYERAKQALAECARIDECKDWANKAEALASYFQQSKNEQMIKDCRRIQARAIERCGELLMEIKTKQGARTDKLQEGDILKFPTRESVATAAGLSEHQRKTALRVVSVPKEQRDALIESNDPPTVTQLAEQGRQAKAGPQSVPQPLHDLEGIDPYLYARATELQGAIKRLAAYCQKHDPKAIAGAFKHHEKDQIRSSISHVEAWIDQFIVNL